MASRNPHQFICGVCFPAYRAAAETDPTASGLPAVRPPRRNSPSQSDRSVRLRSPSRRRARRGGLAAGSPEATRRRTAGPRRRLRAKPIFSLPLNPDSIFIGLIVFRINRVPTPRRAAPAPPSTACGVWTPAARSGRAAAVIQRQAADSAPRGPPARAPPTPCRA